MKSLYLLRHAKSDWSEKSLDDHDRPLSARGERAAAAMGQYFTQTGVSLDLALCSTATRARQTWDLLSANWPSAPDVEFESGLYLAGSAGLLNRIKKVDPSLDSVLVIGHNPDIERLILGVARKGRGDSLARAAEKVPTCAFAELCLDGDTWSDFEPGTAVLEKFVAPKDLV